LTIYNLVMDPQCRMRYEMKSHRKENLLRLRRYLNDVIFEQLPILTELLRTLEELSISGHLTQQHQANQLPGQRQAQEMSSAFFVELCAENRERIMATYKNRWAEVAKEQLETIFVKESPEELKRIQELISIPRLDAEGDDEDVTNKTMQKTSADIIETIRESAVQRKDKDKVKEEPRAETAGGGSSVKAETAAPVSVPTGATSKLTDLDFCTKEEVETAPVLEKAAPVKGYEDLDAMD